ncbi:MAG: M20/M25/M40 family metallo-hydrolase, partial [Nitrospiraceae bacterium]
MPKILIGLTLAWMYSTTLGLVTLAETVSEREELAKAIAAVSGTRMLADVTQLSSAGYHGRQSGTPDDHRSGLYVAERFGALGLRPTGTTSLGPHARPWATTQRIPTPQISGTIQLELSTAGSTIPASLGPDYLPIFDSPAINATATVVFVGYGIADPSRGFDEYEGLDVRNRVVLFLRGKPRAYPVFLTLKDKQRIAREKGAVAFLTATGPIMSRYEAQRGFSGAPVAAYSEVPGERPLPGAWISTELAESIMASQQRSLRGVQEELNRSVASRSVTTGVVAHLRWNSTRTLGTMVNVLGITPGDVKTQAQERQTIVVGAHRDHFGRMGKLLFPGADDNASGTAIVLEVARALAQSDLHLKRNIVFVSFSGEEQGLLGSKLYIRSPAQPLNSTAVMINVDH